MTNSEMIHRCYEILTKLLESNDSVTKWISSNQQDLGGQKPQDLFDQGKTEVVWHYLEIMYAGGPT